MTLVDLQLDA